jgi:Competence protein J (ComJ)
MSNERYEIDVLYRQIALFKNDAEQPFPYWTDAHVRQGSAWRNESVGFARLQGGRHLVEVQLSDETADGGAVRVIEVPFDVPSTEGPLRISTPCTYPDDEITFELPSGSYALRFDRFERSVEGARVRFIFTPRIGPPHFEIIRGDAELDLR